MNVKKGGRRASKKEPGKLKCGKREGKILKKFSEGVKQAEKKSEKAKGRKGSGKTDKKQAKPIKKHKTLQMS